MDNRKLDRYPGDYDKFLAVYEMKKNQVEAAYNKQQKEIADLKDFVARNKARVATRNMAMSRQKKLDKMVMRDLFGKSKTAPTKEERERARKEYLDRRGTDKSRGKNSDLACRMGRKYRR